MSYVRINGMSGMFRQRILVCLTNYIQDGTMRHNMCVCFEQFKDIREIGFHHALKVSYSSSCHLSSGLFSEMREGFIVY